MRKKRILLIEDAEDVASLIKLQAEMYGYLLHVEVDGVNGLRAIEREKPDLVILDIMLPGQNGFDVCRKMKSSSEMKTIPLMILSAKQDEMDIVLGLELGADDYLTKPFSSKILFSRIKALLRRMKENDKGEKNFTFGDFVLEVDRYILRKSNQMISLTLSEFGILRRLLSQRGEVLSRSQLLDDVDNDDAFIVDRNIDVHIASLRKKLQEKGEWIETVRGVGYRFTEKDRE
ncbi:MAG: response regulator transcription factor [Parachlamydiales bacterium]|nr:response regulator transcription factor [Parachlamydiales bacterium]